MNAWRRRIEYVLVRLVIAVIQIAPLQASRGAARWLAFLAADVFRLRGRVVDDNLAQTFPHLEACQRRQLARGMWEHLVLMVVEIALVGRKIHETNWRRYIDMKDAARLSHYLLADQPVVLVSGHFGNFEVAAVTLGILGFSSYAIARSLDNPWIDRWLARVRESKGQFILPKDGSADAIQRLLDQKQTLLVLGDQHAGIKGVWVDFLGRPAACHKALALFTLRCGAPMIATYCRRAGDPLRFQIGVLGVADPQAPDFTQNGVAELTQWYNDQLANIIRQFPEQYWWVHRRWKKKPVRQTSRRKRQAA